MARTKRQTDGNRGEDRDTGATPGTDAGPALAPDPGPAVEETATILAVEADVDPEARERRLAAKKRYRERAKARKAAIDATPDNSAQQAALLITILSATASTIAGPGAAMLDHERELIEGPLIRMIARMPAAARENLDKYIDPATLLFGLAVWGMRAWSVRPRPEEPGPVQEGAPYPVGYKEPEAEAEAAKPYQPGLPVETPTTYQDPAIARALLSEVDQL